MELDDKAWRLLSALQHNARASLKELADATGLSIPATAERLKRLQEAGIIRGFQADVDPAKVGYPVQAWVGIQVPQPGKGPFLARLSESPQVLECHHVSGHDSYLMHVIAESLQDLESFLSSVNAWGETRTSIVFSTPIQRRSLSNPAT